MTSLGHYLGHKSINSDALIPCSSLIKKCINHLKSYKKEVKFLIVRTLLVYKICLTKLVTKKLIAAFNSMGKVK